MGDEKTMIFAISEAGTFLVIWKKDDNGDLQPMILWIAFHLAIIFDKDLVYAGGLGAAKSLHEFLPNQIEHAHWQTMD